MNDKWEKEEQQLDNLINIVENHTRTERHLEQYSHIGDEENVEHARKIQNVREEEIEHLKDNITGKEPEEDQGEQIENLKENYAETDEYMNRYKDNIDDERLENMKKRQENRLKHMQNNI